MANTKKPESEKTDKTAQAHKSEKPTEKKKKVETKAAAHAPADKPAKKEKKSGTATKRAPLMPKTFFAEQGKIGSWKLIDASGQTLGRLSSHVAQLLMGKTNPGYTRHHDTGDSVVVINASKVRLTGNKWADKKYNYHTNFPGGIKTLYAKDLLSKHPEWLVEWAVHGMLPTGHMGRRWRKKLRVFAGAEHSHTAQNPTPVTLLNVGSH